MCVPRGIRRPYFFEQRLPEAIRQFGLRYVPGMTPASEAPAGFVGAVNGLFEPPGFDLKLGLSSDLITPADFDGDGRTDAAVFRASTGVW